MKRHTLELIPTKNMSREVWLSKRMEGIGGSDVGTILGLNKRFSNVELFHQKCGITLNSTEINIPIQLGNDLEPIILRNAQYLDLETGEWLSNLIKKNKIRELSEFKYMVRNPKYPWLIANVDALEGFNRKTFLAQGVGEMKSTSRQAAEMWETFPPYHYMQVEMYHTVLEPMLTTDTSRIFYLEDTRNLYGYEIPFSREVSNTIIEETYDFWERVVKGREIFAKYASQGLHAVLQELIGVEPTPYYSEAYTDYLSDLYKLKEDPSWTMIGDSRLLDHASQYSVINKKIKKLEEKKDFHKTKIMEALRVNDAGCIRWEDNDSKVTFNKRMYVNIRD